ncbi:MAG: ABC transporter ATP-binding protein, partial [Oscillospiraceae bacterium]
TANLDYGNQLRILEQIVSLASEGYSIVLSTHHPEQAFLYAGQVLALLDGRVLCCGPPNELVTAELMLALYGVEVVIERLHDDRFRVCIPKAALRRPPNGGQG